MNKSDYFILGSAVLSLLLSVYFWFQVDRQTGLFIGIWVPSLLGFGNYLKLKYQGWNND